MGNDSYVLQVPGKGYIRLARSNPGSSINPYADLQDATIFDVFSFAVEMADYINTETGDTAVVIRIKKIIKEVWVEA